MWVARVWKCGSRSNASLNRWTKLEIPNQPLSRCIFPAPSWQKAKIAYWYRKFYQETRTGQLMVLRPDEPTLHYFPEGRHTVGKRIEQAVVILSEFKATLWWFLATFIGLFQPIGFVLRVCLFRWDWIFTRGRANVNYPLFDWDFIAGLI
jgi:hypothetical protein